MGQDHDTTASALRDHFRFDRGQALNLALTHLAMHPEYKQRVVAGLGKELSGEKYDEQVRELGNRLANGEATVDEIGVARFVDLLPNALGIRRHGVFEILRDVVNRGSDADQEMDDAAIVDMLWSQLGNDSQTLNNLALEYLAQGTSRVPEAIESMRFDDPVIDIEKRLVATIQSQAAHIFDVGLGHRGVVNLGAKVLPCHDEVAP